MKQKGFTLIELLAVIVILGVILVIAIPSISAAILNARKNAYVATANELVDGLRMMSLTNPEILPTTEEPTCYKPNEIKLEKGSNTRSPFGKDYDQDVSQVCVRYEEESKDYIYSICLVDTGGTGIEKTNIKEVTKNSVTTGVECNIEAEEEGPFVCNKSFLDERDGKRYTTVEIEGQCWFKENLKYTGNGCLNNTWNSSADACLIHSTNWGEEVLYQWRATMNGNTTAGSQDLCPDGWYVPTDNDWKQLEIALGMTQAQANNTSLRGTDEGTKLKDSVNWNGTNTSGFTALPAGFRHSAGSISNVDSVGHWWTSSIQESGISRIRTLSSGWGTVERTGMLHTGGASIRCLLGQ